MQQTMNDEKKHREDLMKILMGLAGNFGDTMDTHTISMWRRMFELDGIGLGQIKTAAVEIMRTRKISKMPTYAEFLEYVHGSADSEAQAQADVVVDVLRSQGSHPTIKFSDPITQHLMSRRWPYKQWASSVLEKELVWWRKDFVAAYADLRRNPASMAKAKEIASGPGLKQIVEKIGG